MKHLPFYIFRLGILSILLFSFNDIRAQTAGKLDLTFGTNGLAFAPQNGPGLYEDMAVQTDNKIVVAGSIGNGSGLPFANVARFTDNGMLDTTFDNDGFVQSRLIISTRIVTIQSDGKILVGGILDFASSPNTGFIRLNSDGSPDTTLNGNGQVITTLGMGFNPTSINVQTNGKIIVAGTTTLSGGNQDFGILRYNADGTLDTTFGTGGRVATDISGTDYSFDSAIQPDGKIVVIGYSTDVLSNVKSATLVRYNFDGSLDAAFGNGGKIIRTSSSDTQAEKIAIQSDGKIIIDGNGILPLRYNPNGTLETTFQGAGSFLYSGIAVQTNGKIIISGGAAAGDGSYNFSVLRYNSDGMLDTTFASGKIITPSAGNFAEDVFIQSDGKIVAGGSKYEASIKIVLARYISDTTKHIGFDYDDDGTADLSVFRPDNGVWYLQQSTNGFTGAQFGVSTDKLVPADYDGDGKTDLAVYRSGMWYLQRSSAGFTSAAFGDVDDIPQPADFDGDGKAELAVFRPSNGTWYVFNPATNQFTTAQFGAPTDKPVVGDYNGDGKADYAIYRPSNGTWYIARPGGVPSQNFDSIQFGDANDKPVPADYDGDGKTDVAVFRPSNGSWYLNRSQLGFTGVQFGISTDLPAPADYDGDGKADVAVFRSGTWYINRSTAGFTGVGFGAATDRPVPNAFIP